MVMLNGLNTERCGNVGLACSWSSNQNHIVGIFQKFASMQLAHQRFIYFAVAKLKASQIPIRGESGYFELICYCAYHSLGCLCFKQLGQDRLSGFKRRSALFG